MQGNLIIARKNKMFKKYFQEIKNRILGPHEISGGKEMPAPLNSGVTFNPFILS